MKWKYFHACRWYCPYHILYFSIRIWLSWLPISDLSQLIRSTGRTQYLGSIKASGRTVSPHHVRLLTILRDRLSVGTQYLELMEVMIKYWTGMKIKKQSVPRIVYVFDTIADKDNRFMEATKRNHLHREQEKMEVLTSKAYLSSINILVLNFFLWIQPLWKCLVFQTWIFFSKYE